MSELGYRPTFDFAMVDLFSFVSCEDTLFGLFKRETNRATPRFRVALVCPDKNKRDCRDFSSVLPSVFSNSERKTGPFQEKRKAAREDGLPVPRKKKPWPKVGQTRSRFIDALPVPFCVIRFNQCSFQEAASNLGGWRFLALGGFWFGFFLLASDMENSLYPEAKCVARSALLKESNHRWATSNCYTRLKSPRERRLRSN